MNIAFSPKDKKRIKIASAIIVVGLIILGVALSPILNPPQCTSYSEQAQTFSPPGCVTGANIGLGLVLLLDIAILLIGIISLIASVFFSQITRADKFFILLPIMAISLGAVVLASWYIPAFN